MVSCGRIRDLTFNALEVPHTEKSLTRQGYGVCSLVVNCLLFPPPRKQGSWEDDKLELDENQLIPEGDRNL
jgi:hypothetical protein